MRIEGERGDGTDRKRGKRKVEVGKKGDGMEMCLERGSSDVITRKVSMKLKIKIMIAKLTMIATRSACECTQPWARLPFWASPPQNR